MSKAKPSEAELARAVALLEDAAASARPIPDLDPKVREALDKADKAKLKRLRKKAREHRV